MAIVETCDAVVHAGDVGGEEILDRLRSHVTHVVVVRGNNDAEYLQDAHGVDAANALPRIAELVLPGGKLIVEHGHAYGMSEPDHQKLRKAHPQAKLIVYGHTHKRVVDRSATPWVVNPGAAGAVRNDGGPSCLVLHASEDAWEIDAYKFGQNKKARLD